MILVTGLNPQFDLKVRLEAESMNKQIDRWSVYNLAKYEKNEVVEVERPS